MASVALAAIETEERIATVAPFVGEVIVTVGAVVSPAIVPPGTSVGIGLGAMLGEEAWQLTRATG
jgi:hypothetical protein